MHFDYTCSLGECGHTNASVLYIGKAFASKKRDELNQWQTFSGYCNGIKIWELHWYGLG